MNRKTRSFFLLAGGALVPVLGGVLWWSERGAGDGVGLATWVGLAALTIVLVAVGVAGLRGARDVTEEDPVDYRHAWRLFAVIGGLLVVVFGLRLLAVPETFGEIGHYRAAAPVEARLQTPRHVGAETCAACHDDIAALHAKDVHVRVACETCHGPGDAHAAAEGEAPVHVPTGKEPCLVCHRLLTARPSPFPQIRWQDHYAFVGVADGSVSCTVCHDPHEPLYLDRDVQTARLHPLVHRCVDCHTAGAQERQQDASRQRPPDHPPIFECGYCHGEVVADFETRAHAAVRCTTCHLFLKVSDFAGRIIRDADPRFCLLCHRAAPFRSDDAPPGIAWPDHLEEMGEAPDAEVTCVDCHREDIHAPPHELRGAGGER